MASRRRKAGKGFGTLLIAVAIAVIAYRAGSFSSKTQSAFAQSGSQKAVSASSSRPALRDLTVHFIDVGQGDSIFVNCGGRSMLIDTGVPEMGPKVVAYLQSYQIKTLDVLVGTHPHSDHIGGMADVLSDFTVKKLIMPRATNNTSTFDNLVSAIAKKGLKITAPQVGSRFSLGGAVCTVVAPNRSDYEDLNDMSVVIRLVYKGRSFLFTGDASGPSEADMLKNGQSLRSEVLKVGHHGSKYATSAAFLKAVHPKYAVISVGAGNDYGHPAASTLKRLEQAGVKVYRTDRNGTVVFHCDGGGMQITTEK